MIYRIKNHLSSMFIKTDILMLVMLCLLMVDMVWIKPIALFIGLLWMKKEDWKGAFKTAPPFYIAIIGICVVQYFLLGDFSRDYFLFWCIGVAYWLMCLFAFMTFYSRIGKQSVERTEYTLDAFFLINALVTVLQMGKAMYVTQSINPFAIWDNPVYGTSTGDHLKGIFLAPCYINFFACSFFAVYYVYRRKLWSSLLAVILLCLTSCNFAIIYFLPLFVIVCLLIKVPKAKLLAAGSVAFIAVFYLFISVGNSSYLMDSILKKDHSEEKVTIGKIDTTASYNKKVAQHEDVDFFKNKKGKIISVEQTFSFLGSDWKNMLFGAGVGNFSSLLAQRQSDVQQESKSRLFKMLPTRVAPAYAANHYKIERHIYNLPTDWHSIQHLPSSFLNQILGEYGVIGAACFVVLYVGYILQKTKFRLRFLPIALLLGYYFLFDYLFEYLSIVVLFEIFFITDMKQCQKTGMPAYDK